MTKFTRHMDGFIPAITMLEMAQRNPGLIELPRSLVNTQQLWKVSEARNDQLFRFLAGSGTADRFVYDAQNTTTRPGTLIRKEGDPPVSDKIGNDGYDFLKIIYDYYLKVHGRNSIDANGMPLKCIIHYDVNYMNAFWDGVYMTVGDGDKTLLALFMLLNVLAHEMTHGVTEYAVPGGIDYQGMSGGNNEAYSDKFAAAIESWYLKLSAKKYHFLVGKGIWAPAPAGAKVIRRALRDMRNPGTAYNDPQIGKDPQPATMKDYVKTWQDNGGVHINSGLMNRIFALFCDAIEDAGMGDDWDSTIGRAAKIAYAARPNVGNTPSFAQVAYWEKEACAIFGAKDESRLRELYQKACDTVGVVPDRNATDTLTPARGGDDIILAS